MSVERQLPRVMAMHDVPDVEGLCLGVLTEVRRRYAPDMTDSESATFLTFLLGEIVIVEAGDPRTDRRGFDTQRSVPFRLYAYGTLRNRLVNEIIREWGRDGRKRVMHAGRQPGSEDGIDAWGEGGSAKTDTEHAASERGFQEDPRALEAYSDAALPWLLADGDGAGPRSEAVRDLEPRQGVARVGLERSGASRDVRRPDPFVDCAACGWRAYRQSPNGEPGWHFPDACPACGSELWRGEATAAELAVDVAGDGDRNRVAA